VVPVNGARITLGRSNGQDVFTGYLISSPQFEYLGWGEGGPVYRYAIVAESDEAILDQKRLPARFPFVARSAGSALRQITQDLLPDTFDTSPVADVDTLARYSPDARRSWSQHATEIALRARACYRVMSGALVFAPIGATAYPLDESAEDFSPAGLRLQCHDGRINDLILLGDNEPQAYVRDYFVGDDLTRNFYLSQIPFDQHSQTWLNEEYSGTALDPVRWEVADPSHAISVGGGKLQISGGNGIDGQTTIRLQDKIELGSAFFLQHGDFAFTAASHAVIGGLYSEALSIPGCLAGFQVTPAGSVCNLQALVQGSATGSTITTLAGRHYVLTTRLYASEVYRLQQSFHSSLHPAGNARGGASITANVRVILEVHAIDPADPSTIVAPATVLYDGVLAAAPGFCTYALVNAANLYASATFTRLIQAPAVEVRSALSGSGYRTRLVGALSDGAECTLGSGPALDFFSQSVPHLNEAIEVRYRGIGRARTRITDPDSIAALAQGARDGVRGVLRHMKSPEARTSADCESAALAVFDDFGALVWSGEYHTWSDFLPGAAADIFPGDALHVNIPSRNAAFTAVVREVAIEFLDLAGDRGLYRIQFAEDGDSPLGLEFEIATSRTFLDLAAVPRTQVGATYLENLTGAAITAIDSTSVTLDAGMVPPPSGGVEVRWSDVGWGPDNDRNLIGRFSTQSFSVPRLSRVEDYFLRLYDNATPPRYSRYSAALHLDYPYEA
jgi:hypothetical protein